MPHLSCVAVISLVRRMLNDLKDIWQQMFCLIYLSAALVSVDKTVAVLFKCIIVPYVLYLCIAACCLPKTC